MNRILTKDEDGAENNLPLSVQNTIDNYRSGAEWNPLSSGFHMGYFLQELMKSKHRKDGGSVDFDIYNNENCAAHMYCEWILGFFYLPDKSENAYNKDVVLNIVLFHDIVDAFGNDELKINESIEDYDRQKKLIEEFASLGVYMHNGSSNIADLYYDFENKNDINVNIARELDNLANLIELYHYVYEEKKPIEDFQRWERDIKQQIHTIEGKKILDIISAHYVSKDRGY